MGEGKPESLMVLEVDRQPAEAMDGIVAAIADVPREAAEAALERTGGAVKPAVLVARGRTPQAAAEALAGNGGHLAPLL